MAKSPPSHSAFLLNVPRGQVQQTPKHTHMHRDPSERTRSIDIALRRRVSNAVYHLVQTDQQNAFIATTLLEHSFQYRDIETLQTQPCN